ncbi:winged helix-turn-helix domain-containing protein [Haloplanus aerogenes]|uniref:ArsR family transcriptional regulator n=1 Tax=Haloplanus aerogenes TaxID=660522 RepID=A0A3M0CHK2_9EURY|nr:winged helix-turn-helix domain-containing protein [Haloplanus aerogenes]AZH27304.1 ArsR family transcriptional regulator [Haloplanus aerogenes]RMB08267.1 sugar-specific transcriptional regulator TrmB [Haloplanus aerogenes]
MPTEIKRDGPENDDAYSDDAPLTHVFGESGKVKILSALLSERDHDLTISDIHKISGVARSTVYENIGELQEMGLVVKTRERGGSQMYQINTDNEIVDHISKVEELAFERLLELER